MGPTVGSERVLRCPLCGFEAKVFQPSARMWHGPCPKRGVGRAMPEMKEVKPGSG